MCLGASRQEEYVSRSFLSHGKRLCSSSILYSQWEFYSRAHKVAVSIKNPFDRPIQFPHPPTSVLLLIPYALEI